MAYTRGASISVDTHSGVGAWDLKVLAFGGLASTRKWSGDPQSIVSFWWVLVLRNSLVGNSLVGERIC